LARIRTNAYYCHTKGDKGYKGHNKCDICNNRLVCQDDVEDKIDMLEGIKDSYESEYDTHEPWLLLCAYCQKEYLISGYQLT
jgi:hypothetical protein